MNAARPLLFLVVVAVGCSSSSDSTPEAPDYTAPGALSVGVLTTRIADSSRERTLRVEVWYPASSAGESSPVLDFEEDAAKRTALSGLLDAAPPECVAQTTNATRDAPPIVGSYPVIVYTHCYACTRWSAHFVIEWLVSHGFVVVSADHEGDTLFDRLDGTASPLDDALVDTREADVRVLLDRVLQGAVLPNGVTADTGLVGLLGHSIGSVTAGRVAQNDDRFGALVGMAAPMENILYGGVSMEDIDVPLALLEATEDNSIGEVGNVVLQDNFETANTPAYKLDIIDAGHWSVTNIAEITEDYKPGCGDDLRQVSMEPFTYVAVDVANEYTASFVAAFFAAHLLLDPNARNLLASNPWPDAAPIQVRN
jgi:predicted dienelactone hydrolase